MNFIKKHLVNKITSEINKKQDSINFDGFFYFDKPINGINRVNRVNPYKKEEIVPISWDLNGSTLLEISNNIKNNNFYFYKKLADKAYKIRFKNELKK